ncbi:hypothetical protein PMY35_07600 [Clostridium tertium]|uniref:hypothetical protein n=1 Tax=Clostridium tertium TaxID=1559 RepID=UPI00189E25E2|nr:hypothetical protein [Clostridium tertium]MDB1947683.1 hypothetical protein [Clostridium tertium]
MNKVEIKLFLGEEVRVVNNEYIVLKDMFNALGRVKEDGGWNHERRKLVEFLELIGKLKDCETLGVLVKQGRIKTTQQVECLKLERVPVVLTQFRPSNRKGIEALSKWKEFMIFVDELLVSAKAHKFIIEDAELEKMDRDRLSKMGGSPIKMATMVNYAMGVIVTGEKIKIKKDDLKSYANQTTIDLLEARRYWIEEFIRAYKITRSHSESNKLALEFTLEHYGLNEKIA